MCDPPANGDSFASCDKDYFLRKVDLHDEALVPKLLVHSQNLW
jgi:hypothetical protein